MRRCIGFFVALAAMFCLARADGPAMSDDDACMDFFVVSTYGVPVDTVGSATFRLYRSYHADTTGMGYACVAGQALDGAWKWRACNCSTGVYDAYWDSAGAVTKMFADNPLWFRTVGDTTITSSDQIGANVIITGSITNGTILPVDLDAVAGPTDEDILTYDDGTPEFEWHTPAELGLVTTSGGVSEFARIKVDSITPNDSTAIYIDQGAYILPVADGAANNILKTDGAGNVTWEADATGAGDIEGVTAGDGLGGGGTSGTVTVGVLLDAAGGLETVDDSVNVKLDGPTLAVSSSGLKANIVYGVRLLPKTLGEESFYCAGADVGDCVLVSWASRTGVVPICTGTGYRDMTIIGAVHSADSIYVTSGCYGATWAGGDSAYSWLIIDP